MKNDLQNLIGANETILYEGKPDKKCFIAESIFNKMLPIAIAWGIIDFGLIGLSLSSEDAEEISFFLIPFFALHLMPVWFYLAGVISSFLRYKNTYYIITDHAIYVSGGAFSKNFKTKPFAEMSHIDLHRGIFDQLFGVGDVIATSNQFPDSASLRSRSFLSREDDAANIEISNIADYSEVFHLVKKLQTDIFSDTMYPNDMRPPENHGYNTKYRG
ncbi:MAG: PH domain-containing protein [Oscillospiraceae bacterium]|nr:PH domain-containing protein [Oscillospiraceae bacterium]